MIGQVLSVFGAGIDVYDYIAEASVNQYNIIRIIPRASGWSGDLIINGVCVITMQKDKAMYDKGADDGSITRVADAQIIANVKATCEIYQMIEIVEK